MTHVAFQGEPGAYSESAVYQFFGSKVQVKPCRDFRDVFESVKREEVASGVVPVENSLEGSINQNYDLFFSYDLKVCGEVIVKVEHCLIVNPGTTLDSIKTVYSHPQALAQCRTFLEHLKYELVPTYDTAGSVKLIKEQKLLKRRSHRQRTGSRTLRHGNPRPRHRRQQRKLHSILCPIPTGFSANRQRQNLNNLLSQTRTRLTLPRTGRIRQTQHQPNPNRIQTDQKNRMGIQFLPRL